MATKAALNRPAPVDRTSFTNPKVASAQNAENSGAVKTHTCGQGAGVPAMSVAPKATACLLRRCEAYVQIARQELHV